MISAILLHNKKLFLLYKTRNLQVKCLFMGIPITFEIGKR